MKDQTLLRVTEVVDDDTGIWANDIVDFGIYTGLLENFLKQYREIGVKDICETLDFLKKRVHEIWEKISG